jgi:excisionase family DNA binding protein
MNNGRSTTTRLMDVWFAELDEHDVDRLAELLLPRLEARVTSTTGQNDGWLGTNQAAAYLGISRTALHKATAARTIPFEQDAPGCKCWFKRSELDAWRCGQKANAAKTQPRDRISTTRDLSPAPKGAP